MAKMALGGQFDDEKTQQEMLLEKDHQIATMQRVIDEQERRTEEISEESDNGAIDLSSKLHELHNQMNEKDANKQRTPTYADKTKNATNVDHKDESKNIEAMARVTEELRKDFQKDADRLMNAFNSFGAIWNPEVPISPSKNLDDSMDE